MTKAAALAARAEQFEATAIPFAGLLARLRQSWSRRRTSILLADLDDRTLEDIGFETGRVRRTYAGMSDWVVQSHSGTARLVFIGR